jgi:hypothetical protein
MYLDSSSVDSYKSWVQIASNVGSLLAIIAAAAWFVSSNKFRRRIQLDVDGKVFALPGNPDRKVLEIQICLENKGFIDHKIKKLTISVHALESETKLEIKERTGELIFKYALLKETNIHPERRDFYFVRPGVRQVVSHIVPIDGKVSMVCVTAGFDYDRSGYYPHTARHVFSTATDEA